jgi:hypothetical protein
MNQKLIDMVFSKQLQNKTMTFNDALKIMWEKKLLQTGEIAEQAVVKKSKGLLKQNTRNKKSSDFSDNSELKYSTVQYNSANCGRAQITGLRNKTGLLRVIVFEPITKKNYYFKVPHKVYNTVTSPKIYFDSNGGPRTPTRRDANFNMWEYECTEQELSTK